MKKKVILTVIAVVLFLGILFAPIPQSPYEDGGTRQYTALTYKIVDWNRLDGDGVYTATKVYWFPNNFKSIDQKCICFSQRRFLKIQNPRRRQTSL